MKIRKKYSIILVFIILLNNVLIYGKTGEADMIGPMPQRQEERVATVATPVPSATPAPSETPVPSVTPVPSAIPVPSETPAPSPEAADQGTLTKPDHPDE